MIKNRKRKRTLAERKRISEGMKDAERRGIPLGRPAKARLAIEESKHMIIFLKGSGVPSNEIAEKLGVSCGALSGNGFKTF